MRITIALVSRLLVIHPTLNTQPFSDDFTKDNAIIYYRVACVCKPLKATKNQSWCTDQVTPNAAMQFQNLPHFLATQKSHKDALLRGVEAWIYGTLRSFIGDGNVQKGKKWRYSLKDRLKVTQHKAFQMAAERHIATLNPLVPPEKLW